MELPLPLSSVKWGLISVVFTGLGCARHAPAGTMSPILSLTVRPHEMATGRRTERIGEQSLDSLKGYTVYVPSRCVGTVRCPLVVSLDDHGMSFRHAADHYGMIVLNPSLTSPFQAWSWQSAEVPGNRENLNAALTRILQRFAIDPDKIALVGHERGAAATALLWGGSNVDVFSRVAIFRTRYEDYPSVPHMISGNKMTEFLLLSNVSDRAVDEGPFVEFKIAGELRHNGYPVTFVFNFGENNLDQDDDVVGHWLQQSWGLPNRTPRAAPAIVADPLPLLTPDAVARMTAFWTRFMHEPESIRVVARRAHQREVLVPIRIRDEETRALIVMTDMVNLSATCASVAADLKASGLTAQEHDAYRIALIGAKVALTPVTRSFGDTTSTLGKNIEFVRTHMRNVLIPGPELAALQHTGIWSAP